MKNGNLYFAAMLILNNDYTLRQAAKAFDVGKSTLHIYIHTTFKSKYRSAYAQIKQILQQHFKIKHINGGKAHKLKCEVLKNAQNNI